MELSLSFLQHYWWLIISLLGGILVFLMLVQGGQTLLCVGRTPAQRSLLINAIGTKWKLGFTTLVTFGGAFFASFPLFYSTSFSGAFYVWMAILLLFVLQGVAFEFRSKPGNWLGQKTYEWFLMLNGIGGTLLIGMAVGTLFTGANFIIDRGQMANFGGDVTISRWATHWYGLEAVTDYRNWALGLAVLMLSRCLALQYFINAIDNVEIEARSRKKLRLNAVAFVICFLTFLISILLSHGWAVDQTTGVISIEKFKYYHNLTALPLVGMCLAIGVLAVLAGLFNDIFNSSRKGIWLSGAGTILTVTSLLLLAGYNDTAYYPSLADTQSSLTIFNSSSSRFTLLVMSYVSLIIPIVVAYIWYAWWSLERKKLTEQDVAGDDDSY